MEKRRFTITFDEIHYKELERQVYLSKVNGKNTSKASLLEDAFKFYMGFKDTLK